jgi:hypothetical protein
MPEKPENDGDRVIETQEGSAGGPQTHDPAGTRRRAETPGMLPPDELDERQRRLREKRRTGGPRLTGSQPDEADEDVAPTETEEPPAAP